MDDASKLKDELKHLRKDKGELSRIKGLIKADGRLNVHDLESIEKKFVLPAEPGAHPYQPGEHSLRLAGKDAEASELSKLKDLVRKEEASLSKLKGQVLAPKGRPTTREVSFKLIERIEKTKLAELERRSKMVDQHLSSSLEPAQNESAKNVQPEGGVQEQERSASPPTNLPDPAGGLVRQPSFAVKSNLNAAAIPTSGERPQQAPADRKDALMAKEEAVDNRPLGEIIAEEEARDKEKLAKEMEKEAAEDAKKAAAGDKKDAKPAGKFAALLGRIIPHPAKKPEPAPQQAGAQAQPAAAAPAQPTPAVPVQPGAPGQPQVILVPQFPQMTAAPGKVTVQEEVDLRKLTMDVEKLGAEFSALKETKTQSDERLQRIAEDVGELRSLFFQREEAFRETQSTAEKLKSAVEDIEPDKFLKALHKGESEIMILQSKAEKFEHIFEESGKQMKDMRNVLENVKGIENLKELLKEINAKSSKVEEMHGSIERSTGKVEKLYVEVDKKLGEFNSFKAKVIALDELTKELVKIVDEAKIKLDDTPNKSEFAALEKGMQDEMKQATDSLEGVKQQLVSQLSDIQSKSSEISASVDNFKQESRMQVTAVQMQFDKELAELRQQALMIIDAVKEEVQRNTINIDEIRRMDSYVELDRRIREHSLPSANQPFKPQDGSAPAAVQQPFEEPKPVPRSISPSEVRDSMEELNKRKAELTRLSDFLEDEYHRGIISERSYRESLENAKSRLSEISRLMEIKGKVLKDMPHSAGADDGRDLYYSPERVKREVERETPVSRLLDVQDRFEKINGMLSVLSESRNAQGKVRPSGSDGSHMGAKKGRLSPDNGSAPAARHSGSTPSSRHSEASRKQDTEHILSKVKELRMSLDDKLDAARSHEHKIRQVHMEKERLKKYHPAISKPKK